MSKVKYLWRIVPNHDCFDTLNPGTKETDFKPTPRFKYWYFKTREMAEKAALPVVEKCHRDYVKERAAYSKTAMGREEFDEDEQKWWQSKPKLNLHRTKRYTVFLCGEGTWDSRDRRGRNYGCIERIKVLMAE